MRKRALAVSFLASTVLACGADPSLSDSRYAEVDTKVQEVAENLLEYLGTIEKIQVRGDNVFILGEDGKIFQIHPNGHGNNIPGHFHLQMTTGSGKPVDIYLGSDGKPIHQIRFLGDLPEGGEVIDNFFPNKSVPTKIGTLVLGEVIDKAAGAYDVYGWATDPVGTATETVVEKLVLTPLGALLTAEAVLALAVNTGAIVAGIGIVVVAQQMQDTIEEWNRVLAEQSLTPIYLTSDTLTEACRILVGELIFEVEYDSLSTDLSHSLLEEALADGLIQIREGEDSPLSDCFDIVFFGQPGNWTPEPQPSSSPSPSASPSPTSSPGPK